MASELFHDLYNKAYRLDCGLIHKLTDLAHPHGMFFPFKTTVVVPLAESLLAGWVKFKGELHHVAIRHGMYRHKFIERCPNCGQADCPGAIPMIAVQFGSSGAMLSHLLDNPSDDGK